MYLFVLNLRDAGEMQRNFDHEHPEVIGEDEVRRLHHHKRLVAVGRGEEAEGLGIIERRLGITFFDLAVDFPEDQMDVGAIIVANFEHVPKDHSVINGDPYEHMDLAKSPVIYRIYRRLTV
jgi:hypothetical protein